MKDPEAKTRIREVWKTKFSIRLKFAEDSHTMLLDILPARCGTSRRCSRHPRLPIDLVEACQPPQQGHKVCNTAEDVRSQTGCWECRYRKCQKTMSLSHGHCGQKVILCPSLARSWTKRVTKVVKKTKSHEKNRNSQKFRKVFSFWTKSKRKVFESQNSFFHVLKLDFRDFAFFEVRRFRRPIHSCSACCSLRFLDHQAVAFKWTSWSRQAELSELSIL